MPDKRVTELDAIASVVGTDLVMVVDDPAGTPVSKKATVNQVLVDVARTNVSNTFTGDQTVDGDLFVTGEVNPVLFAAQKAKIDLFTGVVGDPSGSRTVMSRHLTSGLSIRHDEDLQHGRVAVGNYDTQIYQPLLFEVESFQVHTGVSPGVRAERLRVHPSGGVTVGADHTVDPGGGVIRAASLDLTEGVPLDPSPATGRLYALDVNGYTQVEMRDANANVVRFASDNVVIAKVSGVAITRGQCLYLAGATGANPLVGLARADVLATMPGVGLALDAGMVNDFIRVLVAGTLQLLNTSAFAEGARLYVSATTAGALTTTLPVAPAFAQRVGIVTRSHATEGEVLVQPTSVDGPPRLHNTTHETGGTDALTALNAAILTTGELADARLSANVVLTTDPRLTNARTPTAHAATHNTGGGDALTALSASILTTGTVPAAALVAANLPAHASRHNAGGADALAVDAVAATGSLRTIGTGALQAAAGNDARFTDARTPTTHRTSHETGGADALTVLSASILTTGVLPDARLSANVLKYTGGYPGGTVTYLRADGTFAAPPAGTGDVVGPGSVTNNAVALFSGTTGKLLAAGADGTLGASLSIGTTPATIGALRLANTGAIQFRNAANNANVQGMIVGADSRVAIGSKANPAETAIAGMGIQFDVDAPYWLSYAWNGAVKYTMSSNGIFPQVSMLQLGSSTVRWSDVCADIVTLGLNASTAGGLRLPNATGIYARNQANTANVELLNLTNVNVVTVGGIAVTNLAKLDTANTFTAGLGTTPLNATYLTTGTVADARLTANVLKFTGGYPGGTATFLRADGTFAAPPSAPVGEWVTYTPTIKNASDTALSYTSVSFKYALVGKMCFFTFFASAIVVTGATTGHIRISVPVAPAASAPMHTCIGHVYVGNGATFAIGRTQIDSAGYLRVYAGASNGVWPIGNHELFGFDGFYEIA